MYVFVFVYRYIVYNGRIKIYIKTNAGCPSTATSSSRYFAEFYKSKNSELFSDVFFFLCYAQSQKQPSAVCLSVNNKIL